MALFIRKTKTGYSVAKFGDSDANVFIYRRVDGAGYVGIRREVFIQAALHDVATADRDAVQAQVAANPDLFQPVAWAPGIPIPNWAGKFTPGQPTEDFFGKYIWYSYQDTAAAEAFLEGLAPNPAPVA